MKYIKGEKQNETEENKMKYVILVSHGTFAPGLHSVLKMLVGGNRSDVLSASMEDGMGADDFIKQFEETITPVKEGDEIILLADIIGGSPLTNAMNVLSQKNLLKTTMVFGGMNLPMALTAAMIKDNVEADILRDSIINESRDAITELELNLEEEVDDEI